MSKIVPLISSGTAGPLGVLHLPRLWQKVSLAARGKLAEGYKGPGPGYDYMVIEALGFEPEDVAGAFQAPDMALTEWRTIRTAGRTKATTLEGVFAAGDIVRGASLVVWAVRDGQDAAVEIEAWLTSRERAAA
jgi:glutamate synthase (NADPH/NADH) small chain